MIHAYDESYLYDAKRKLAIVIDYLAYFCKLKNDQIQNILSRSKSLNFFCLGHPTYLSGMSGIELAMKVASEFIDISNIEEYQPTFEKTPEYWTGWVLADYCWYKCKTLGDVFYAIDYVKILNMYHLYHEMDITQFYETMDKYIKEGAIKTRLRIMRELNNLSQSQLAKKSGVSLRSIQLYEQRVNDIDKAQVQTLFKLAKTLNCSIEKILENPANDF